MIILTFIRIIIKRKKLLLNISSSITFISKITQYLFIPFNSIDKFNHQTDRLKRLLEHNINPLILMCRDLGKKREFMGREAIERFQRHLRSYGRVSRDTTNGENTSFPRRFSARRVCQRTESIVTLVFVVINCVIAACVFEYSGHLVWRHGSFLARRLSLLSFHDEISRPYLCFSFSSDRDVDQNDYYYYCIARLFFFYRELRIL